MDGSGPRGRRFKSCHSDRVFQCFPRFRCAPAIPGSHRVHSPHMARPSKPNRHKSGQWRTEISGREYWLGTDQQAAYRKFAELLRAARGGKPAAGAPPGTIASLIAAFKLQSGASTWTVGILEDFNRFAGDGAAVVDLADDALERYAEWLPRNALRGMGLRTVRHKVAAASQMFRWAERRGWLRAPRRPSLPRPARRPRDIASTDLVDVFAGLPARAGAILRFVLETGCRPGEACRLRWVDVRGDTAVIPEHKTARHGQTRTIFLPPGALAIIAGLERSGEFVFTSRLHRPYTPAGLRSILRRRGATPYQLRHTFAQAASESLPLEVVSRLLGHADLSTTQFYFEVRDKRARTAAASLAPLAPRAPRVPTPSAAPHTKTAPRQSQKPAALRPARNATAPDARGRRNRGRSAAGP